ncbi:MAG: tol-pal system protein YbgF [Acidobacteria bacterium]|nr:MAG: tol-pal system protein YbgF [Acidobacteriota bacterium]
MLKWIAATLLLITAVSCVEQSNLTQDITDIKSQIWRIQKDQAEQTRAIEQLGNTAESGENANKTQADIQATLEEINGNINILFERVRDLNDKMTVLLGKIANLGGPGKLPETGGPASQPAATGPTKASGSPEIVFSSAYTNYLQGHYDVAAIGFKEFATNYPDSDKVDNALYWLGLCYYEQEKYRDAISQFEKVINDYPDSDVLPAAMLRKGLSLLASNSIGVGVVELQDLNKKFPLSKEARIARNKLDELRGNTQ